MRQRRTAAVKTMPFITLDFSIFSFRIFFYLDTVLECKILYYVYLRFY